MDADLDGDLDLFVGVDNTGANAIRIWDPGTDLNISPSTTSISSPLISFSETATNYNWMAVATTNEPALTDTDLDDGGKTDYFLSFSVPFSNIVYQLSLKSITIDENTPLRYVSATATQDNSLNQDLNGVSGSTSSTQTWAALGAISDQFTADGPVAVPEPTTVALVVAGLSLMAVKLRRSAIH